MKPARFAEHVRELSQKLDDIRMEGCDPTEMLALLDKVLSGIRWNARPEAPATKSDATGDNGKLVLRIHLEIKR